MNIKIIEKVTENEKFAKWKFILSENGNDKYKFCSECEIDSKNKKNCVFILLNPASIDPNVPDETIKNCYEIAKQNEYKSIKILELSPFYNTKPECLKDRENTDKEYLEYNFEKFIKPTLNNDNNDDIIIAWGNSIEHCKYCDKYIKEIVKKDNLEVIHVNGECKTILTKKGNPRHPATRSIKKMENVTLEKYKSAREEYEKIRRKNEDSIIYHYYFIKCVASTI